MGFPNDGQDAQTVTTARAHAIAVLPPGTRYELRGRPDGAAVAWYTSLTLKADTHLPDVPYGGVRFESGTDAYHLLERGCTPPAEEQSHG
jgi:hypothetical protein